MALIMNGMRPALKAPAAAPRTEGGGSSSVLPKDGVPLPVAQLIERCWAQEQNARPVFPQIVMTLEMAAKAMEGDLHGA